MSELFSLHGKLRLQALPAIATGDQSDKGIASKNEFTHPVPQTADGVGTNNDAETRPSCEQLKDNADQRSWMKSLLAEAAMRKTRMPWERGLRRSAFITRRTAKPAVHMIMP